MSAGGLPESVVVGAFASLVGKPDRRIANADHDDIHQTIRRATAILESVWRNAGPSRLADIARATGLDRSTALRLIHSLEELGYLHRDPASKAYRIGYMAQRLGARPQLIAVNVALARPFVESLAGLTGETVVAAALEGTSVIYYHCIGGTNHARPLVVTPGVAYPAHACASGKALLGNLSTSELMLLYSATPLVRLARRTIGDVGSLSAEIAQARLVGHAVEHDEAEEGRSGLAVPVVNARGFANMAIGIIVRSQTLDERRREWLGEQCQRTVRAIYDHVLC